MYFVPSMHGAVHVRFDKDLFDVWEPDGKVKHLTDFFQQSLMVQPAINHFQPFKRNLTRILAKAKGNAAEKVIAAANIPKVEVERTERTKKFQETSQPGDIDILRVANKRENEMNFERELEMRTNYLKLK